MTLKAELLAQQETLAKQQEEIAKKLKELRLQERSEALKQAVALISEYEFTQQELFAGVGTTKKVKATGKVAAKYRDDKSDKTWTGRGVSPKWISASGKDKSAFLIT
jgi:DNA-binding protein H-NS